MRLRLTAFLALLILLAAPASAAEPIVSAIEIHGNHFVERETVLAYIETRPGQTLDRRKIAGDVKRLFRSGFFSDVRVEGVRSGERIRLIYRLSEYPLVRNLEIRGNDEIKTKDLKLRLKLKPGAMYNERNIRADIRTIRKGYLKKGYYQVQVETRAKPVGEHQVDVVIDIHEGAVTGARSIRIVGNRSFDDAELKDVLASREPDLSTLMTDRDIFDRKRIGADAQLLQQFYMNRGFLDVRVASTTMLISPDLSGFDLVYSIEEGTRYRIGKVELAGDLVPDEATLRELVALKAGELFRLKDLQKTIDALTDRVGDEGYAFATVTPQFKRDPDAGLVDVRLEIEKGRETYIERIEVRGNEKTIDGVVRRELRQAEAARYSASRIRRSKEALPRTGLFKDARVSLPRGSDPNKVNMRVEVEENKTGSFTFGVGYSQLEKTFIQAKLNENNLLGRGYQANVNGSFGKVTQNYTASFTDPYFLGERLSASINIHQTSSNQFNSTVNNALYDLSSTGGGFGLGVPLSDTLRYDIGLQYERQTISNVPAGSTLLLQAQQGRHTTLSLNQSLSWDTRDRPFATREGTNIVGRIEYAGLGGTDRFVTGSLNAATYLSFEPSEKTRLTLNPSIEIAAINGIGGRSVPLYRRFSMGGIGSLRGFDYFGVSLRDPATQEAIGGDRMARASLNLFFPLPFFPGDSFRGVVFGDAGLVWGSVQTTVGNQSLNVAERFALSRLRASLGFGIEWASPVGPISLSWGFPVRKQAGDIVRNFEFGLGASF